MEILEFWTILSSNGIVLSKEQVHMFERYHKEMLYWNAQVNLISRKDEDNFLERHLIHSLSLLKYIDVKPKARVLDVGTGGGLPGLPLIIARNDLFLTMVDSVRKKVKITEMFGQHTGLRTISVLNSRAEDLSRNKEQIKKYDLIVTRAVAKIPVILDWIRDLIKPGGKIVFYKGGDMTEEIQAAIDDFPKLKYKIHNIDLFGADWFKTEDKKLIEIML